ncbi:hypothetical protein JKP88DRAFT_258820 [Tribonema minus]|uniref:Actin n=1 Tax=Tribonema minus TaxID=303371 RepID=A0A836C9S7_9STRA|nr:hypothetical protein JKP88DRAFT_258820 [Tribonema minus]
MDEEAGVLVVDVGSGMCKAGLAHEATPRAVFRSVVGRSKNTTGGTAQTSTYVGDAAISAADKLNISNPIQRGVVTNGDDMETLWQHIFADELRTSADEHAVVLCKAMLTTDADRQRMGQMMFEKFNARAVYFIVKPVLSLYASGRTDGCVVQSGDGVTHTVPSPTVSFYLSSILLERGYRFTSAADLEAVRDMKRLAYVALNFASEKQRAAQIGASIKKSYALPDGRVITVGDQRFRCAEPLFSPAVMGAAGTGIHKAAVDSISACDAGVRKELYRNVVLAGGNTMCGGIAERMVQEMTKVAPAMTAVKIVLPTERKYSAWVGGATVGSHSTFQNMSISKAQYEESGPSCLLAER